MITRILLMFCFVTLPFFINGCALAIPALAGAGAYVLCDDADEKKAFHANNTDREKNGLKPLTWEQWEKLGDEEKDAAIKASEKAVKASKLAEKKAFHHNNLVREKKGLEPLTWKQWEALDEKSKNAAIKASEKAGGEDSDKNSPSKPNAP